MEVIRKFVKEVKAFKLGDQIKLGRYTATAVAQDERGTTFCFDQVYGETPVKTPFDAKRMKALYVSKTMDPVRDLIIPLYPEDVVQDCEMDAKDVPLMFFRSPTAEEVFPKNFTRPIRPSEFLEARKRWEAMKGGSYRIGVTVDGRVCPYWTESAAKTESQVAQNEGANAYVSQGGSIIFTNLDGSAKNVFWRPVFRLKA